jgi:hypothetical protein
MAKGGGLAEALWSGTAVYAAVNAKSYKGFLKSFAMYAVVLIVILVVIGLILQALGLRMERFVPIAPSKEGDAKYTTPAGNVVMY